MKFATFVSYSILVQVIRCYPCVRVIPVLKANPDKTKMFHSSLHELWVVHRLVR
jgi:hypothetical protein